ncbi:spore cortex biosynthesis protein YabQ [Lachnospiraceae bacterium ASD3451]|uniref:spore cortex biosynthesis protein YabQ n=1 Tax=Diplocloster agilis TaxID=2850323 RepID=UPI001D5DB7BF|nr:spore cortex biosynthesis protein YabQ [Diplocloster agilis]MBU9747025.1 spore cortex biosynthesis protein YabQ [Diplocloster agilis]
MSQDIMRETRFFLNCVLSGVFIVFIYDVLRIFRRVVKHGVIFTAFEDLCFWVMSGLLIFKMLYTENDGIIRGFSIAAIVLGMLLYNISISPFFVKYISAALNFIVRTILKIIGFLLRPLCWMGRTAARPVKHVGNRLKKLRKFFGKRLKKLGKEVKMVIRRH